MEIKEKLELNKLIRKYEGSNDFVLSLKKSLASKYCKKVEFEGREFKVLSDRQYESAKSTLIS
jgi:hypothetical protein